MRCVLRAQIVLNVLAALWELTAFFLTCQLNFVLGRVKWGENWKERESPKWVKMSAAMGVLRQCADTLVKLCFIKG